MSVTLSLAMIVKNEAEILARVLNHAKVFCDEMVVVDTGSTDDTVNIAKACGARVEHFTWINDFSAARNYAFEQCTGDWVIWLDADDVVPPASQEKILALKPQLNDSIDLVNCSYQIAFRPDGTCSLSMPRERLIRRNCGGKWQYPIHEVFMPVGESYYMNRLDIAIEHHKPDVYVERSVSRNLNHLSDMIAQGDMSPRTWYFYAKELRAHDRVEEALAAFIQHIELNDEHATTQYQAMHNAMTCCMELERFDEAKAWGFKALAVDSSRAEAFCELGVQFYREQQFKKAIPLLMAATEGVRPTEGLVLEENYTFRPWHYLSLCYEGAGEFQKAIEAGLKALPTIPDPEVVKSNIACYAGKL